jgi:hypothetical protein
MEKKDPFAAEIVKLYSPITVGERTVTELKFRAPKTKDLIYAGSLYPDGTIPFTFALMRVLTGESELILNEMAPEDYASCLVIVNRSYQRYTGHINLFEQREEPENPTTADTVSENSSKTSAE